MPIWLQSFIKWCVSGLFQSFLSLFGRSDKQRLGVAETTVNTQAGTIKELERQNAAKMPTNKEIDDYWSTH